MTDPLYRPRTALPGDADPVWLAGVPAAVTVTDTDPGALEAQWMDDHEVSLALVDDLPVDVVPALLTAFVDEARARVADRPGTATAAFALASRDITRARQARDVGFLPASVLAVADLRRPHEPAPQASVEVRDAGPEDVDAVGRLWCEQADYEAAVGTLRVSDGIRAAIARQAAASIHDPATTVLVADDGALCGAIVADSVETSGWAGERLTLAPVSYLAMASTTSARRGSGVGAALVDALHRRHRSADIAASALHYSAFNPLSVPFWSRRGYRPVVTIHTRRLR
ncbi:hypothetical protein [Jatrophihabitans fulvus]